ncbi:hypothetical protein [Streptomyces aureus]
MNDDQYDGGPDDEAEEMDIADEVSLADTGRPWGWARRAIKHPTHKATRDYCAATPFPGQREAGAA